MWSLLMMLVDMDICFPTQLMYGYMLCFIHDVFIEISLVSLRIDKGNGSFHLLYDVMWLVILFILK